MEVELILVAQGGSIGYFTGNVRTLMDDMKELRPTFICGVPRVFTRVVAGMKDKIDKLPFLKKLLINTVLKQKISCFNEEKSTSFLTDLVLQPFRDALGGRLRFLVSGGAPILPEIYDFMKLTLTPVIIQGYGLTETAAGLAVQEYPEKDPSNVGPFSMTSECKLRKVLDYNPRGIEKCGELMVRGPHIFREYYKNPELTEEAKISGEWFVTGDIIRLTDNGMVQIIDRAKQLVKLSQGEYISITSLTDLYGTAEGVLNIYLYADSHHDAPVAVIIPTPDLVKRWNEMNILKANESEIAKGGLISALKDVHTKNQMRGFERISKILIDFEEFSIDNGLMTPSLKPQWQALRKKYESLLIDLLDRQ